MTNITQEDFIRMMREFKNTIENTIEISVNNVGKKINDNIEEKLHNMDLKMRKLGDDVTEVDRKVTESDEKNVAMNKMLRTRIETLEMNNKRTNLKNMKSDTLRTTKPDIKASQTPEDKGTTEEQKKKDEDTNAPMIHKQKSWSEEVEETWSLKNTKEAFLDKQQWQNNRRIPNSWTDDVELLAAGNDTIEDTTKAKQKNVIDKETRNHVKTWFGYDDDLTEEDTSEEENDDDNNEEWKKIERKKKKSEKNKRQRIKRKTKIEETLMKAQRMVGLGPFSRKDLENQCDIEEDFEKVKIAMIEKHLRQNYKYNSHEIKDLKIVETKIAIKDTIFIYIAVENIIDIRDLYKRKAEIRRDDLILKNYIPPQLFARFNAINRICRDRREEDRNLKTQVRFGDKDLEVLTKTKGENEPFVKTDLKDFIGEARLPLFDDSQRWRHQKDRKPRRRVTSSRHNSPVRISNMEVEEVDLNTSEQVSNKLGKHQLSVNSVDDPTKRPRHESSLDSCHSADMAACKTKDPLEDTEDAELEITL